MAASQSLSFYGQGLRDQVQEEVFDADRLIAETRLQNRPFEQLRDELEKYGKALDVELLDLINRDYTQLVSLSANLSGLDRSVDSLKTPIRQMLQEVSAVRSAVKSEVDRLETLLERKRHLQRIKSIAQRFILIDQTLSKMEELLSRDVSGSASASRSLVGANLWISSETSRLQRLTNDLNTLLFHIEKAGPSCPFVQANSHRIHNVETLLLSHLKDHFSRALSALDQVFLFTSSHLSASFHDVCLTQTSSSSF